MSDLELLLAAIIRDTEDDTARLVYADCLEESGDTDRAALIRWQVQTGATLTATGGPCAWIVGRWTKEIPPVCWRAANALLPTFPKRFTFARGFVESVTVPRLIDVIGEAANGFYVEKYGRELLAMCPLLNRVVCEDRVPYTGEADGESFGYQWWDREDTLPDGSRSQIGYTPAPVFNRMWADWKPQRHDDNVGRWLTFKTREDAIDAHAEAVCFVIRESV